MPSFRMIIATTALIAGIGGASADTTCESVRTDLTGQNVFGQHTIRDLALEARTGNCTAAASLIRRARNAAGYARIHCLPDTDLAGLASDDIKLGEQILNTPNCQD